MLVGVADHRPPALLRVNHMCVRPSQECGSRCLIVDGSLEKRSQNPAARTFSSSCGPGEGPAGVRHERGYDADLEMLGRLLQTHLCVGAVYYIQIRKSEERPPLHLRTADHVPHSPGPHCVTRQKPESSKGIGKRLTCEARSTPCDSLLPKRVFLSIHFNGMTVYFPSPPPPPPPPPRSLRQP